MSELCRILDIDRGCTPSPALPGVAGADGLGGGRSLGDVRKRT